MAPTSCFISKFIKMSLFLWNAAHVWQLRVEFVLKESFTQIWILTHSHIVSTCCYFLSSIKNKMWSYECPSSSLTYSTTEAGDDLYQKTNKQHKSITKVVLVTRVLLQLSYFTKSDRLIENGKWLNEYNLFYMTYCFTSASSSYF